MKNRFTSLLIPNLTQVATLAVRRSTNSAPATDDRCCDRQKPIEPVVAARTTRLLSLALICAVLVCFGGSVFGFTIGQWTFEVNTPPTLNNSQTSPSVAYENPGGNGTASGWHASANTDWKATLVGNGSAASFNANTWAVDDYWQFQVSTAGRQNISLAWDQTSSAAGPRQFKLFWSTDGSTFTPFGDTYNVLENLSPDNWGSSSGRPQYSFSFNLSGITALNNDASVYFRLVVQSTTSASGGTVTTSGENRIDNFTVSATDSAFQFDLTHWQLMLPVNNAGLLSGANTAPRIVGPAHLTAGFSYPTYFESGAGSTMVFETPDEGAFDSGSSGPRSELRGTLANGTKDDWSPSGTHILEANCAVNKAGVDTTHDKKVIIGQIHAVGIEPPITVTYNFPDPNRKAKVTVVVKDRPNNLDKDGDGLVERRFTVANVNIGDPIHYKLELVGDANSLVLHITLNGSTWNNVIMYQSGHGTWNESAWLGQSFYFKAGIYYPEGPTSGDAKATFSSLRQSHNVAPSISTSGSFNYTENGPAAVIDANLTVSDSDSGLSGATVSITPFAPDEDVLGFTDQSGITHSYDWDTGVLTLSGQASVANYQAALRSVTYENTMDNINFAPRTITFQVSDGSQSGSGTRTINIIPAYSFTQIPSSGGLNTIAGLGIDADNNVVGYAGTSYGLYGNSTPYNRPGYAGSYAFQYTGGSTYLLPGGGNPNAPCCGNAPARANAVSGGVAFGSVWYDANDVANRVYWYANAVYYMIEEPCSGYDYYTEAKAVNSYLAHVGYEGDGGIAYYDGTFDENDPYGHVTLSSLSGSTYRSAWGLNNYKQIVGVNKKSNGALTACFWDNPSATVADLGTLPSGGDSEAFGINDAGVIVGYAVVSGVKHACMWVKTTQYNITDLGVLPGGNYSVATAINNQGKIVGFSAVNSTGSSVHACAWLYGTTITDLDSVTTGKSGATLARAYAINDNGRIAGSTSWTETSPYGSFFPQSSSARAFMLTPQ